MMANIHRIVASSPRALDLLIPPIAIIVLVGLGCDNHATPAADEPLPYDSSRRALAVERLNSSLTADGARVVFLGDSITEGWAREGAEIWKAELSDLPALNLGISGDRTQTMIYRLQDTRLEVLSPEVVVLMIGTNNAADGFHGAVDIARGTTRIMGQIQQLWPTARILLLGALPRDETPTDARARLLTSNQLLKARFAESPTVYLDLGHLFVLPSGGVDPTLIPDGVHLSEGGYRILADHILPIVRDLLGARP